MDKSRKYLTRGHAVRCQTYGYLSSRRASPSFDRYRFILLGDRGRCVWTSCSRLIFDSRTTGSENSDLTVTQVQRLNYHTTRPPRFLALYKFAYEFWKGKDSDTPHRSLDRMLVSLRSLGLDKSLKSATHHRQSDARPTVTFPAVERYFFWPVPNYTARWQKSHLCVNNLPNVVSFWNLQNLECRSYERATGKKLRVKRQSRVLRRRHCLRFSATTRTNFGAYDRGLFYESGKSGTPLPQSEVWPHWLINEGFGKCNFTSGMQIYWLHVGYMSKTYDPKNLFGDWPPFETRALHYPSQNARTGPASDVS